MKRYLKNKASIVVVITMVFATNIFSQHVLTSDDIAAPWEVYKVFLLPDSIKKTTGDSGANAVWDFTNYIFSSDTLYSEHILPSATGFGSSFPASGHAEKTSDGALRFYSLNSSEYVLDGLVNDTSIVIPYSDPQIIYKFPFGFGSQNEDDFKSEFEVQGSKTYRTGSAVIKGDSYGTLKFADDTFENVLRVKQKITFQDSSNFFGTPYVVGYDFQAHLWYDAAYKYPIFTIGKYITYIPIIGVDTNEVAYKLNISKINTGINSTKKDNQIQIFQKESLLNIKLNLLNPGPARIEIIDLLGKIIYLNTFIFNSRESDIQLPHSYSSVCILKITTGEYIISRKLF